MGQSKITTGAGQTPMEAREWKGGVNRPETKAPGDSGKEVENSTGSDPGEGVVRSPTRKGDYTTYTE
jgi:hypothetical protein